MKEVLGPALTLLDQTVNHIPVKIFNSDESFIDSSFELYIVKN